jgi:hypothetical protein
MHRRDKKTRNWTIVEESVVDSTYRLQVLATTPSCKFKDDVLIRLRNNTVDMRSKSRVGKSDFGANAKRIVTFINGLQEALGVRVSPSATRIAMNFLMCMYVCMCLQMVIHESTV